MPNDLSLNDLIDYTQWERGKWFDWLRQHGDQILKIGAGPHGDGRFETVGELVSHIFSAEKRYVDRLSGRALTDTASIPHDNIEALFQFSQQSRKELKEFVETFPHAGMGCSAGFQASEFFLKSNTKKNRFPHPYARNPSLGADCDFVPLERVGRRVPRFSL